MNKAEFEKINRLENSHWWYVGTREIAFSLLDRIFKASPENKICDIGCGTGGNLLTLSKYGSAEGIDIDENALQFASAKGLKVRTADMHDLKLPRNSFNLITFFEVLYQTDQNNLASILSEIHKSLKPGGTLLLREPALKIAWGKHDVEVNTKTRFDRKMLEQVLTSTGFRIIHITYLNTLLFLPIVAKRKIDNLLNGSAQSDVMPHSPFTNQLFLAILRIEKFLLRFMKFPFGVSILVLAQKP